jgi:hypothetical protein
VIVRSKQGEPGKIKLTAFSDGLKEVGATVQTASVDSR